MAVKILHNGAQADISCYVDSHGRALAMDFIEGLSEGDQKKIVRLLQEFAARGEIRNREKFRLEEKPIYAFKSFQIRILCFFLPRTEKKSVVLTHGFKKKQDSMPPSELQKAKNIFNEIC
jgi:phage-related protein